MRSTPSCATPSQPWRDVYLNYRRFKEAEFRGGKFKVPFGLDQLTSVFNQQLHLALVDRRPDAPGGT